MIDKGRFAVALAPLGAGAAVYLKFPDFVSVAWLVFLVAIGVVQAIGFALRENRLALAINLLVAGVGGFYLLSEQAMILRVLAVIAGLALAVVVAWKTEPGQRFFLFANESVLEAKKVVWPTRKETMQTTGAVFAFVVVMAVFLYLTDKSLEWVLYDLVLGWKKS